MYQSFVYLEVRILLPLATDVFSVDEKKHRTTVNNNVLQQVFTLAHAFGSDIPASSPIERLTATLPKLSDGKSLTGYSVKVAEGGFINIMFHNRAKKIFIEEIRIEEDVGKLARTNGETHFDFSYAGYPSIRVHTTPSFETGEEAEIFLNELRRLMQYLHLTDGQKENTIRCNAFISLSEYPDLPDYYIKLRNLNSFNFVRKAINSELTRQENLLSNGGIVKSESRLWNETKSCTEFFQQRAEIQRRFEQLVPHEALQVAKLESQLWSDASIVELPESRRNRFRKEYSLSCVQAEFLCDDKERADFFEEAVQQGASPQTAERWISSEITRLLNKNNMHFSDMKLSPKDYAFIMKKIDTGKIHSVSAKQLIQSSFATGASPEKLLKSLDVTEISDKKKLLPFVKKIIAEHSELCVRLKTGDMAPLEFFTGEVMKVTKQKAVPQIVKSLIKKELNINVVYILAMGGAISAIRHEDGNLASGNAIILRTMANNLVPDVPVQVVSLGQFLSEEIEPDDWAVLIAEITNRIHAGIANGIVVTHGRDTLSYTAALLFWLFSDAPVPIVLTASSHVPVESDEAKKNLALAIKTAAEKKTGVYVVFDGTLFSPLNLRFEHTTENCFRNWNLAKQVFTNSGPIAQQFAEAADFDVDVLKRLLVDASGKMVLCRFYPGFRSDIYKKLIDGHVCTMLLELYESGTGNMRSNDFSLKPLLAYGKQRNVRFYCTSQQETDVAFSQYVTSLRVWREGTVPMGALTIESVVALYFACSLVADSREELDALMETYSALYSEK